MTSLLKSELYLEDLKKAELSFPYYKSISNKKFFITGGNGLICSALVDILISLNLRYDLNLTIYLATRNELFSEQRFLIKENSFIKPVKYDANAKLDFNKDVDFYIHGASNASPDKIVQNPLETIHSNLNGLEQILDSALKNNARVLYISSSEVYGLLDNDTAISENQYGYIDILNFRSSYSESKRCAETLCASYKKEYNSDYVVARPGHIYGPSASITDKRVSSVFMYKAKNGEDLILKSKGEQIRSYCYSLDCATALLSILIKGESGEAYNISNKNSIITIKDMANIYAAVSNVSVIFDLPKEDEKIAFNPMKNSSLNSEKLESLGWRSAFTKEEGFYHSINILKELDNK